MTSPSRPEQPPHKDCNCVNCEPWLFDKRPSRPEQDEAVRLREAVKDFLHRWDNPERYHRLPAVDDLRAALASPPPVPAALDVERLTDILGEAEGDGIIGPDYTPPRLAEYIVRRLTEASSGGGSE